MKIQIRAEEKKIRLWLPLWSGLVRIGLAIGRKYSDQVPSAQSVLPLFKALKQFRRDNGPFTLVEVESPKDNTYIKITL